jgi:hypothetical protein
MMAPMPDLDRANILAAMLSAEVQSFPWEERIAFRYLLGRVAVELGVMEMTNDVLPQGGMRLVLHIPGTRRTYVAERPKDWSPEEEEERLAAFRERFKVDPAR